MSLQMFEDDEEAIQLPHPSVSLRFRLVIENAIRATWERMVTNGRPGFDLQSATEDVITHELYERLYDEVFDKGIIDGFDREIVSSIHREPKIRNFNGKNLDKMPDMFVSFVDRPGGIMHSQHGLFIECKPIDKEHPVGSAYCDEGVIRFVRGDYAWTMREALMIGYVRPEYTVIKLSEAFAKRKEPLLTNSPPKTCNKSRGTAYSKPVYFSEHNRSFRYQNGTRKPGPIVVRHLWLDR